MKIKITNFQANSKWLMAEVSLLKIVLKWMSIYLIYDNTTVVPGLGLLKLRSLISP